MKPIVMHVRASNFFGGPERQILGHIQSSRNYRHLLVTFLEGNAANELLITAQQSRIHVQVIRTRFAFDPSAVISMRRMIMQHRPCVICSHGYKPSVIVLMAKAGLAIPLIIFSRGHTAENLKVRIYETIERFAMHLADSVVAVSKGYAKHLMRCGLPRSKIKIVHNAIDAARIASGKVKNNGKRESLGLTNQDFVIATAGRLSPEKAQADLIKAFARIQPICPSAHLLIIGDGPLMSDLKSLAVTLSVSNIHFAGFRRDLDEIMSVIDLFVLPSLTEGLPNVVLEAFAASKPVVATNVGGVPEVIDDGLNGFLCPPGDPDQLSKKILKVILEQKNNVKMGVAGLEKIKRCFSLEVQTESLEIIYNQLSRKSDHVH